MLLLFLFLFLLLFLLLLLLLSLLLVLLLLLSLLLLSFLFVQDIGFVGVGLFLLFASVPHSPGGSLHFSHILRLSLNKRHLSLLVLLLPMRQFGAPPPGPAGAPRMRVYAGGQRQQLGQRSDEVQEERSLFAMHEATKGFSFAKPQIKPALS